MTKSFLEQVISSCFNFITNYIPVIIVVKAEEVLPATWKADLAGEEWHILATPSEDIFSADKDGTKGNFNRVAKRLFDSQ